jgi:hypothetical protein
MASRLSSFTHFLRNWRKGMEEISNERVLDFAIP